MDKNNEKKILLQGKTQEELLTTKMELGKFLDYALLAYADMLAEFGEDIKTVKYHGMDVVDLYGVFVGNVCQRINVDNISKALKEA